MIAFLDANALIYLFEGTVPLAKRAREKLQDLATDHPGMRLAMSALSRLECRTGPLNAGDAALLAAYDTFFSNPDLIVIDLSVTVIDLATAIRARHGLKTPDALQAASCLQLGNQHVFVTGDRASRRVAGLHVELLR